MSRQRLSQMTDFPFAQWLGLGLGTTSFLQRVRNWAVVHLLFANTRFRCVLDGHMYSLKDRTQPFVTVRAIKSCDFSWPTSDTCPNVRQQSINQKNPHPAF